MLFLLSLLLGCSDISLGKIEQREAEILVHPTHINFGNLVSGLESDQKSFTVINTGDDDLIITSPFLSYGEEKFALNDESEQDIVVAAGELIEFQVTYTPETFEHNFGSIEFLSTDEDESQIEVTLEGYGDAPVMSVDPIDFDYGNISIGCDNEERITITNDGNLPLTIENVVQMVTQPADVLLEFGSLPALPWYLDPGVSVDFLVSYIPTDIGRDDSIITIFGNDPYTPEVDAIQYGTGDIAQYHSQRHIQEEIQVLDILWVIDDSGSMNRAQTNLASNMQTFMNVFAQNQADYRMAVITTSDPMVYQIVDSNTPNATQTMQAMVAVGVRGSGIEMGLEMAYQALNDPASAGPGSSFFRNNSDLVVIFVSDEPDQSPATIQFYTNFFTSLKPAGMFFPYAVIGDVPGGCAMPTMFGNYNVQPGTGYWDVVDHFYSQWFSLCATDWGNQLQNLANNITGHSTYELEKRDPIESTIEVYVNGQLESGWIYNSARNAVEFTEGNIPEPGDTIEINYALWGCHE